MKLELVNINKSFADKQILHDICFSVQSGKAMGFLGRNGAGKTTTFRCLLDVFKPTSGTFLLDGKPFDIRQNKIGYLPEERGLYYKVTLFDQLVYFGLLKGGLKSETIQSVNQWIDFFGLTEYKNKKLETLSKGNQQKIQIAQALLNDPDILILDEPFSGLDPVNSQVFKEAILQMVRKQKLVIFSSHQMAYVEEMCDEITLIDQGRVLISGSLEAIKKSEGEHKTHLKVEPSRLPEIQNLLRNYSKSIRNHEIVIDAEVKEIFPLLQEHVEAIVSIGQYRPSLQDVFVRKVGE